MNSTESTTATTGDRRAEDAEPKTWAVTLPIAGHAYLTIEAESKEAALEAAFSEVTSQNIETWEAVEAFHKGNVCYCPHPWEAEAVEE